MQQAGAAPEHRASVSCGHWLASTGTKSASHSPSVSRIAEVWPAIPPHVREAILTLVDAAILSTPHDESCNRELDGTDGDALVWQLARQCRSIVQGCLREEEWQDADREFFAVIAEGLAELPVLGRHGTC